MGLDSRASLLYLEVFKAQLLKDGFPAGDETSANLKLPPN